MEQQLSFDHLFPSSGICAECDKPFTYTPTFRCETGEPNPQRTCDPCLDRLTAGAELSFERYEQKLARLPDNCRASYEVEQLSLPRIAKLSDTARERQR